MCAILFAWWCGWIWLQEPTTPPEKILEAAGFRVSGARLVHRGESAAADSIREANKLKKEAKRLARSLREIEAQLADTQAAAAEARELDSQLNVQLAEARNVAANNQIVARLNVLNNERQKLYEAMRQLDADHAAVRRELAAVNERYYQMVREGQAQCDSARQAYARLSTDPGSRAALDSLATAIGKPLKGEPPTSLQQNQRKLVELAESIREESLPAVVRGNTLLVSVRLGADEQPFEMVVDSGASIVCIPADLAAKARIEIPVDAPRLTLKIADGSEISARQVRLPVVRVGPFSAENVEAAILGPEATSAPALLGMSFLGRFHFSIDLAKPALLLRDVTDD